VGRRRTLDAAALGYQCDQPHASGWTIDTLRQHVTALLAEKDLRDQQRFEAQSSAIAAALLAAEKAVTKAEAANERRFEGVNEFRQTLSDQAATFISRVEFDAQRKAYEDRVRELAARVDKTEGRTGGATALYGYLIAAAAIVVAVISLVTR
jgi:Flp pilus assembly protein TadB